MLELHRDSFWDDEGFGIGKHLKVATIRLEATVSDNVQATIFQTSVYIVRESTKQESHIYTDLGERYNFVMNGADGLHHLFMFGYQSEQQQWDTLGFSNGYETDFKKKQTKTTEKYLLEYDRGGEGKQILEDFRNEVHKTEELANLIMLSL